MLIEASQEGLKIGGANFLDNLLGCNIPPSEPIAPRIKCAGETTALHGIQPLPPLLLSLYPDFS